MKNILVTGINGFVGRHLARELAQNGHTIYGTGYSEPIADEIADLVARYEICDLRDPEAVAKLSLDGIEAVINLAGIAINNPNETEVEKVINTNILSHTNLYDRLASIGSTGRIVAVSSGAIYSPENTMPLTEDSSLLPEDQASAYIKSKIMLERELAKYNGVLDIVVARPFNHTGPGQRPGFIVPDWADRFVRKEELDTSILNSWRDFTDVRDVVRAYRLLAESDSLQYRTYNIASGAARLGYNIIQMLAKEFDMELPGTRTEGQSVIYGSAERLANDTGWATQIPIGQTIHDFAEWRKSQA